MRKTILLIILLSGGYCIYAQSEMDSNLKIIDNKPFQITSWIDEIKTKSIKALDRQYAKIGAKLTERIKHLYFFHINKSHFYTANISTETT